MNHTTTKTSKPIKIKKYIQFGKMRNLKELTKIFILGIIIGMLNISCKQLSYTPKGIDPIPLFNLKLQDDLDICNIISNNDSVFAQKYNCSCSAPEYGGNWKLISVIVNDTNIYVGRRILIVQFEKQCDALEWYKNHIKRVKVGSCNRMYKEKQENNNRYFIAYQTIGIDYNHGIPFIGNYINLELGFLLNNYCVFISYLDFSATSKKNYKDTINNDIILVSEMLNDILNKKNNIE
jgi:hypothetical protein